MDHNIREDFAIYEVRLSDKEICSKFSFGIDTIIKIKNELIKNFPIKIKLIEIVSKSRKYKHYKKYRWGGKYLNFESKYLFVVPMKGRNIIYIPTKIIYEKNLTYSEKLAILYNLSLRTKHGSQPKLKEIEKESGISGRTIRKAKEKYPQFFMQSN